MCIAIEIVSKKKQIEDFAKVRAKYGRVTFSVKKFLKQLFKQRKLIQSRKVSSLSSSTLHYQRHLDEKAYISSLEDEINGSLESFENSFNSATEIAERTSLECYENAVNEQLSAAVQHQNEQNSLWEEELITCNPTAQLIASSLQFVRTDFGTFFWSTNSKPIEDQELIKPLDCNTDNQIAIAQSSPSNQRIFSNDDTFQLELCQEF